MSLVLPPSSNDLLCWPTAEDYTYWWGHSYRQNSSWWPSPPPAATDILALMQLEAAELLHRAPIVQPSVTMANIREHLELAEDTLSKGGGLLDAHAAIRRAIKRDSAENRSAELFPYPRLRRGKLALATSIQSSRVETCTTKRRGTVLATLPNTFKSSRGALGIFKEPPKGIRCTTYWHPNPAWHACRTPRHMQAKRCSLNLVVVAAM